MSCPPPPGILTINNDTSSTPHLLLPYNVELEKARARNLAKSKIGGNIKDLLKHMKKLNTCSTGELERICHTHEIGMDLLTEVCLCKAELKNEEKLKCTKKLKQRYDILKVMLQ